MISTIFCFLAFHILYVTAIENVSVKILQINLLNGFQTNCDNIICDIRGSDIINFVISKKPDVILLLSDSWNSQVIITNISNINNKIVILPISSKYSFLNVCFDYPENNTNINCYYSKTILESKLNILILNTLLWVKEGVSSEKQFIWLRDRLREAEFQNIRVIIAGYKAPGSLEISNGSLNFAQQYNELIVNLLVRYSNIIKACIFGEEYVDTFRIILNKERKPVLPIFISPLSTNNYIKEYTYNQSTNEIENCYVYHKNSSNYWQETYNCKSAYSISNMSASSWSKVALSLLSNGSSNVKIYFNQSRNIPSDKYCKNDNNLYKKDCVRCRLYCFIIYLTKSHLDDCVNKCNNLVDDNDESEQNNGVLFVFGVIAGFVIILFGIVLAVNKVYCIRRGRQRNIFLAPLTLNIQAEVTDDIQSTDMNGKITISKDNGDSQIKNSNGFRRTNHEVEQTYNYIRM